MRTVGSLAELCLQERPPAQVLLSEVVQRANGKVEHVDRVPARNRVEALSQRTMVTGHDRYLRVRTVHRLEARAVRAVVLGTWIADADGHPFGEEVIAVRARREVTPHAAHAPVARRHRREDLLEGTATRPPELVRIAVDDPVRPELGRGAACHSRDPLRLLQLTVVVRDVD